MQKRLLNRLSAVRKLKRNESATLTAYGRGSAASEGAGEVVEEIEINTTVVDDHRHVPQGPLHLDAEVLRAIVTPSSGPVLTHMCHRGKPVAQTRDGGNHHLHEDLYRDLDPVHGLRHAADIVMGICISLDDDPTA